MNGGLGSPVFFYYGSVPYHLTSLLHPLFTHDPHGWRQLGVSAAAALCASGLTAYLWLKQVYGPQPALLAATLYMLMPYHLAIDLYERGAFAEFWAFVWMPLILYFVCLLARERRLGFVGLTLSYAMLIMTHLPTTLIFSLVPLAYACFKAERRQRVEVLLLTLGALASGVALSAVYLFPAMLTQGYVAIEKTRTGFYYYEHHFLFTTLQGRFPLLAAGLILLTLGLAFCAYVATRHSTDAGVKREGLFWFAVAVVSTLLMTPLSKPVWRVVPPLQAIQFPWRFGTVLTIATAALVAAGCSATQWSAMTRTLIRTLTFASVALMLLADAFTVWDAYVFTPGGRGEVLTVTNREPERLTYNDEKIAVSKGTPGFQPRWAAPLELNGLESLLQKIGQREGGTVEVNMTAGGGRVVVERWRPRDIRLEIDAPTSAALTISQFYYPGWTAELDNAQESLPVRPTDPDGLLTVAVPAGHHYLSLRLARNVPEYTGQLVSAVSALAVLFIIAIPLKRWPGRRALRP